MHSLALVALGITTLIGTGKPGFDDTSVNNTYGLMIGPDKALYFCDIDNHAVRRLDLKTKKTSTVIDKQGQPYEVRFDKEGNLFFVDMPNHVVQRIDRKTKAMTLVAGTMGKPGFSGDGGPATQAQFRQPHSIAFDRDGSLLVCDIGNHRVRRIDMKTGVITTLLGNGERKPVVEGAAIEGTSFNGPRAINVAPDGTLYLVLREGNAVYKIDRRANKVNLVAGTGKKGLTGDGGPAKEATLNGPKGIASAKGKLYLADTENHVIRAVDLKTGIITTVAGSGQRGDGPDGDPKGCKMNRPHGIFAAPDGTLYIGDSESHRIRVLR